MNDVKSSEPISTQQQWLIDHIDRYVIRSKVKDEVVLFEDGNIKYYCELEVSINCLEFILMALTADRPSDAEQMESTHRSKYQKKLLAALVEGVASHAIVIEYSPVGSTSEGEDTKAILLDDPSLGAMNEEQFTTITEDLELQFAAPFVYGNGTAYAPIIRLVRSSLRRNVKRRKAKPEYPVYMWLLGGSHNKRIIPPKHATDFVYRLLEGKAGYPLNYWGACINDLASQGIIEVIGKKVTISDEGAGLVERLFDRDKVHDGIYWKVRVGRKGGSI